MQGLKVSAEIHIKTVEDLDTFAASQNLPSMTSTLYLHSHEVPIKPARQNMEIESRQRVSSELLLSSYLSTAQFLDVYNLSIKKENRCGTHALLKAYPGSHTQ